MSWSHPWRLSCICRDTYCIIVTHCGTFVHNAMEKSDTPSVTKISSVSPSIHPIMYPMWATLIHYFCECARIWQVLEGQLNRLSVIIRNITINYGLCLSFFSSKGTLFSWSLIFFLRLLSCRSLTLRLLMSYIYIYIYIWSTYSWCF